VLGELDAELRRIRNTRVGYDAGIELATLFIITNNGKAVELPEMQTKLVLGDEEAICYQPYPDIDLFYYES
jgi:hypothetical protein